MNPAPFIQPLLALLRAGLALALSPLLLGVINRTKASFAGRNGQPLLQSYYDLWKLLHKGAVYSRTTTWVFRAGPIIGLAAVLAATTLVPLGGLPSTVSFSGDLVLFAYLLGLTRFFTVIAALDTGSSFEGMGASREVTFSALAEPALLLGLAALARQSGSLSLSSIYSSLSFDAWLEVGPMLALVVAALMVVLLAENARIPVDDPNTHLELTMIHEVMVLDHSGPDLAFILYNAALKLWVLSALLAGLIIPIRSGNPWLDGGACLLGMLVIAIIIGIIESSMARLRLLRVPQLLVGASALAVVALILSLR
jgi:formate hydrogenlyase subunit 4